MKTQIDIDYLRQKIETLVQEENTLIDETKSNNDKYIPYHTGKIQAYNDIIIMLLTEKTLIDNMEKYGIKADGTIADRF